MEICRFTRDIPSKHQYTSSPLQSEYELTPVLTLEPSIQYISNIIPDASHNVSIAKEKCARDSTLLTWDESAAIYIYTMPKSIFSSLNNALRDPNSRARRAWLPYLKLLTSALEKLPSTKTTIWRGISYDATLNFVNDDIYTWWGMTSCSMNVNRVRPYLGESGTLFTIEAVNGKDISKFSAVSDEQEVVFMPGTRVCARHQSLNIIDRFYVIHLQEIHRQK